MGYQIPQAPTEEQRKKQIEDRHKIKTWKPSDFIEGFKEENLFAIASDYIFNNQTFPIDDNYNAYNDPQLKGFEDHMDNFIFSRSANETTAILHKLQKHHEMGYHSPWHMLGRLSGALLDPSTLLFFTKFGQAAKIAGSALLAEELTKQYMNPVRDDSYVPFVAGYGYSVPFILNKLTANIPVSTQRKLKEYDDFYNGSTPVKADDIAIDGQFVNPNKRDPEPSGVGAAGVTEGGTPRFTAKEQMTGEKFIKSNLKIFGEDGPWTPVFRVIKQNTSLTARKMMGDLLDTPLLKLKNTKEWGFQSTGKSIETDMRMMRVGEIESHKLVKDQYINYIKRTQSENVIPSTNIGLAFHNKMTPNRFSLDEFATAVTKARINGGSKIKEVDAAYRITQEKVYGPLFEQIQKLKIREMPVTSELRFWESQLKAMKKKGEGSKTFTSKVDGTTETYNISRIERHIDELTQRLANIQKGGVNDYINIIYVKNAIEKNPEKFKEIVRGHFQRAGIMINESKLNQLVKDLSNHFPFVRFEKTMGDLAERYAFNRPRYARAVRARELNLDKQAQLEMLDAGFIMGDIFALQKAYARQIIPDILMTRKYGDPNGLGIRFIEDGAESGFEPGLMTISNEYNYKLIGKKGKDRTKFIKERDQVLSDLEASIELIRGTYGLPSNPHAWSSVAMRTMKHWNALSMLTGFAAAIPDVARNVMTSGIKRGFKTQFEMFSDFLDGGTIYKMGKKEAQSFGEAVDMITGQRAMLFADVGDMFGLSSKMEGTMGKLSSFNFMYVNLMSRWTEMAKSMASVTIGSRIIEDSIKWSKAGKKPLDIQYIKIPEGKAMASFNRANNQVVMDLERIKKTFDNKAWTKPRIEGVDPLPANQFKTFDDWKNFIYFHELSHWKNPRLAGETLAQYENRMNKLALDPANIKALKKAIETEGIAIGGLSDKWKTALAASGIDEQMAKRIAVQFEKHGEKTQYNFMANTAKWDDELAVDAFGAALNKDINTTIVTPGLGDTPLWMSTELGSTFAQFKKFAMSSTQRMLMRGMQERDLDFMFGAMLLMGSGMLIDKVYHEFRFNRDYSKVPFSTKLLNAFDRSGLAGIYTDINKAIETLSDNRIGMGPLIGDERPYGSSPRWKAGTIGGPTGGQIYNIFDIIYDVGGNQYNHHTAKNVRRLIPFQNVWYLDWLFDDIQKGLH